MTGNVTTRRTRAIAALMAARSQEDAAHLAGVSRRTIGRWLEDPAFRADLAQAESGVIDQAARRLLSGLDVVIDTLEDVRDNSNKDSDRRLAAAQLWDMVIQWRQIGALEDRLGALEKAVFSGNDRKKA